MIGKAVFGETGKVVEYRQLKRELPRMTKERDIIKGHRFARNAK